MYNWRIITDKINFMDSKSLVWIGMFAGSAIGSYIPTLWGDGFLTFSSVFFSAVGGVIGIWIGFKISKN
jgi:hypothetical protein